MRIFVFIFCLLFFNPIFSMNKTSLLETSQLFNQVAKKCLPVVVSITTVRQVQQRYYDPFEYFFGKNFSSDYYSGHVIKKRGLGSGVLISDDGYILTNLHVIKNVDEIWVHLNDGRDFLSEVVGFDHQTDLALLKIKGTLFPVITFGNSDRVEVGDWAIAIGSPFGLQGTMTVGIVSAAGRSDVEIIDQSHFIQTDAAINPGNSGGALLNIEGELIGINTAIYSQHGGYMGIGFAIPVNTAVRVASDLKTKGVVERGWLGVYVQPITKQIQDQFGLASTEGALISDVMDNSPAAKSGLKRGDIVYKAGVIPIKNFKDLSFKVSDTPVGDSLELTVFRQGESFVIPVTIETSSYNQKKHRNLYHNEFGVLVEKIDQDIVVLSIQKNSPASLSGLREGDIIFQVNQKTVRSVKGFNRVIKNSKQLLLLISRDGFTEFLVITRS